MIEVISEVIRAIFIFMGMCCACYFIPFCITRGIVDAKKGC